MNSYWKYTLFPTFLEDVKDCTFENYEDDDLYELLNHLVIRSIEDFLFPKVSLEYAEDTSYDPLDNAQYGYYFIDPEIGEAEYKVILAYMKKYWVAAQITWDMNFKNPFFDKDIKGYSPANMLNAMKSSLERFSADAEKARFDYGRINKNGKITWGTINARK